MVNVKKNLGFQTLYQISIVIFPLMTSPYLSRVLGAEKLGIFSYLNSIVGYFSTFALLGVTNYGSRSIAEVKSDMAQRSMTFWELFWMKAGTSLLAIFTYILYLIFICDSDIIVATVLIITIFSTLFDINWLFFGLEQFQTTALRSLIIRTLCTISISVFVHNPGDLYKYVLIEVASTLISNLYMWTKLRKVVNYTPVTLKGIGRHIKPNLLLFVPLAAMSVYHMMDKTMLGIMCEKVEGGYYYNADKAVNIPIGILSGITTVLLPNVTSLINKNDFDGFRKTFSLALYGMLTIAIYMALGITSIAREFTPVFFGAGYDPCVLLMQWLSVVMAIKAVSFAIRYLYLVPMHKEKWYIFSVFVGAVVNLIANYILIPMLGAMGAVAGTLLAEFSACFAQAFLVRKEVPVVRTIIKCIPHVLIGIIMLIIVRLTSRVFGISVIGLLLELCAGGSICVILTLLYWKLTNSEVLPMLISVGKRR